VKLLLIALALLVSTPIYAQDTTAEFCHDLADMSAATAGMRISGADSDEPVRIIDTLKFNRSMSPRFEKFSKQVVRYAYKLNLSVEATRKFVKAECLEGRLLEDVEK
jgi:hypothetical protein